MFLFGLNLSMQSEEMNVTQTIHIDMNITDIKSISKLGQVKELRKIVACPMQACSFESK